MFHRPLLALTALALSSGLALAQLPPKTPQSPHTPSAPRSPGGMTDLSRTPIAPSTIAPETMIPLIRAGFAEHDCALPLNGGERILAEYLGARLGVTADETLSRDGPYFRPIDTAFDQLRAEGTVIIDRPGDVIRYPDCNA